MLKFVRYPLAIFHILFAYNHAIYSFNNNGDIKTPIPDKDSYYNISEKKDLVRSTDITTNYNRWDIQNIGLSEKAFKYAIKGYKYLAKKNLIKKTNIISIIDFSRPSTQKRLYILDVINGKILFNTLVAHGHNSGQEYATRFSNATNSHESSLGFYITLDTYIGDNGYSLRLEGCDKGFNDKAYKREIVLHGSDYVSEDFIRNNGFLGRSFGCPAVPLELHKEIIDCIKNGSCLFIYYPTKKYLTRSKILNSKLS
jgi:hypothetical protein